MGEKFEARVQWKPREQKVEENLCNNCDSKQKMKTAQNLPAVKTSALMSQNLRRTAICAQKSKQFQKKGALRVNTWRFFSTASRIVNAEKRMSAMWARDAAVNEFVVAERT